MKFIIVGDIHLRGNNPRSRKGDYQEDMLNKIKEVNDLAVEHKATVLQVGDLFDSPSVSYGVFGKLAAILNMHPPWFTISGNHDIFGHSLETLARTPYQALVSSEIIKNVESDVFYDDNGTKIEVVGVSFDNTLDKTMYEYKPTYIYQDSIKILMVHGMLLPHTPPFERYSLISEVARVTTADIIISGHYHMPFIHKENNKMFINPGALCRMSASKEEMQRTPSVVLTNTNHNPVMPQIIPLKCAKPSEDVLDRTIIEETNERTEMMEKFISSLEFTSESRFMNLSDIIESIARQDNIPEQIINKAMEKLAQAREMRG